MVGIQNSLKGPEVSTRNESDRIVISGMSGLYPQSHHIKDLCDILYDKVNPISSEGKHWQYRHPEVPQHAGSVPNLDRFDAQFFGVHYRLANSMDTMSRKILEHTFQAIYDAGLNPEHLSGKKVGVYIGSCFSEAEKACFYVASSRTGFGIAGCSKAMFANRISYWLNAKGPSVGIDQACCSSTVALEQAYLALARGECDAAIVGGANISLHPQSLVHYSRIIKLCMDGKTKAFDENADGCAKSEAINVLFLQKAKDAKRIYGDVVHVKSKFLSKVDDSGPKLGFYRDPLVVGEFLREFYDEAGISPLAVEYVEAFGSAVPEDDKAELEAISEVFCQNRDNPLFVGSVMSNIGYAEAATGISAVTKVLLGYHKGEVAANLHCSNPRKDIPALKDGRIQIVTEHQPFNRSFTAINNLSLTGCNGHVLLHGHYKPKDPSKYKSSIPYLVTISGRQESAVQHILDDLKSRPIDPEELALLHNIHNTKITGHLGRGFTILDTDPNQKTVSLSNACEYFDDARRPLWFVYSGMGSQWPGMGTQLMRIPVFAAAIERCQKALDPMGIDIIHIITTPDKAMFNNILHSFIGIAAVQIGLTDVMRHLGLVPDKIIGHSVGELGCAYADGCLTAEEMILSAYSRGLVSVQTPFVHGSMAAVGMGYQQIQSILPPEIEVACHNSSDSSTISGPSDVMKEFVATLTAKGIFAKEVPCSNIAYHSRYIADAGPGLLKYLSEVIKEPKLRSERWLSTSVPQDRWGEPTAKYSSAEYHTNNLLNPVLFEEVSQNIPPNAVLVEIAPHGLLQAILKRSLPASCRNISLTRRGHPNLPFLMLEAIGKLFMEGYSPKLEVLYPKVEFPVSTGTPFLSHLVQWAHNEKWILPLYITACRKSAAACMFIITIQDEEHKYLLGNIVKGKNVYPFAACLVAVWDTFAMSSGKLKKQLSVEFGDINLYVQPILNHQLPLKLYVALHRGTGRFEIMEGKSKIATGFIKTHIRKPNNKPKGETESNPAIFFKSKDIYQVFHERESLYKGSFKSIQAADKFFDEAYLEWNNNWVTIIDGMLQLNTLRQDSDTVSQVAHINSISIDVDEHLCTNITNYNGKFVMKAVVSELYDDTRCGGILMKNIKFSNLSKSTSNKMTHKTLKFVPRFQLEIIDIKTALQIYIQIVAENVMKNNINVIEVKDQDAKQHNALVDFNLDEIPDLDIKYTLLKYKEFQSLKQDDNVKNVDLTIISNRLTNEKILTDVLSDAFVIIYENNNDTHKSEWSPTVCHILSSYNTGDVQLRLARWKPLPVPSSTRTVTVTNTTDVALLLSQRESLSPDRKLLVVTNYPPIDGMKELISQWRSSLQKHVYLVMTNHKVANDQSDVQIPDLELAFNVLQYGSWGGVYYVPYAMKESNDTHHNISLGIKTIGDLGSLHWMENQNSCTNERRVKVHYAGLNINDAKIATGTYPVRNNVNPISFGMDYSGVTDSGTPVMGIVADGACSKWVTVIPELVWPVPAHWTMEEAATVPLPYAHALYCLGIKVRMAKNSSILVHGGAGALGQAAISISLAFGLQVFATVSDVRKKQFLRRMFPELKDDHIGCSRDNNFATMVKRFTNKRGTVYVLNCLPGDLRKVSLECASPDGFVLDTAQIPSNENWTLGMFSLINDRHYIAVDFSSIILQNNQYEMRKLQLLICEGIASGWVRPLSRVSYAPHEAARALRLLDNSAHRGRVLLRLADALTPAQPRISGSPGQIHILACDEEFSGIQLADQLVARGVKKMYINLPKIPAIALKKKLSWEKLSVEVKITTTDLSDNKDFYLLLKEAMNEGPVEGIYFVSTSNNKTNRETLCGIDVASRKFCTSLRYFVVISTDNLGNRICISRVQDRLSATKLIMPTLTKTDQMGHRPTFWRNALDLIESARRSSVPVIYTQTIKEKKLSLLEQIAALSDIKIPNSSSVEVDLKEMGVSQGNTAAIANLLRDEYNFALSEEDILSLSVQQIQDIERKSNSDGVKLKELKGLEIFFSYVDTEDALMATTEVVFMPTLTSSASMRDDEVDTSQTHLCIVPGMEGNYERFKDLCERIKIPALVLQPGLDFPNETISELAERYAKVLLKRISLEKDFYLLGYESGVIVALELAAVLEDHGLEGTVYCLGAPPDEFQMFLEKELHEYASEEALQDAVIRHMFGLMSGSPCEIELENLTWFEKVERCVRALLARAPVSAQYARAQFEAAHGRVAQARLHKPEPRALKSRIVLLQAADNQHSDPTGSSRSLPTSGLQQYSQQPISVHQLEMPLAHALRDLRCAAVVNQTLHPDLLRAFEAKNLCETYLMNADTFMTSESLADVS